MRTTIGSKADQASSRGRQRDEQGRFVGKDELVVESESGRSEAQIEEQEDEA